MLTSRVYSTFVVVLLLTSAAGTARATRFSVGTLAGLSAGAGVEANVMLRDFAQGFPMAMRMAAGYSRREAGKAQDARRIFINDATNGTPEEKAWLWDLRFDFLYDFNWSSTAEIFVNGGVRYSKFTANFKFIGGNEDFDITSDQWGLGLGLEGYFNMTTRLQFVVCGGLDYFFAGTLMGHDTHDDADDAVNQPSWEPRALIGLSYGFGD